LGEEGLKAEPEGRQGKKAGVRQRTDKKKINGVILYFNQSIKEKGWG
jgi:hypothetical protein